MDSNQDVELYRRQLRYQSSGSTTSTAVEEFDSRISITPISQHDLGNDRRTQYGSNHFETKSVAEIFEALDAEVSRRLTDQDGVLVSETSTPSSSSSSPSSSPSPSPSSLSPSSRPAPVFALGRLSTQQNMPVSRGDEEKAAALPPSAVGFWHSGLAQTRKEVLRKYASTLFILCASIMAILSIYWGALYNVKEMLPNVTVVVISFEGLAPYENYTPLIGPFIRAACEAEIRKRPDHLGYVFPDASVYNNDPTQVRLAVYNQDIWAAIIINSNATALLQQAVETGNSSYDPYGAVTIIYNQARDVESYNFHIVPSLDNLAREVTTRFATTWASTVLTNTSLDPTIYSQAPQAVSPGISFTSLNLRPFDPPGAIPTISIGLIYLIIIAFFSFTFFMPTHMKFVLPNPLAPHPPLKFAQLIIYRWLATITAYFFLALSYSLVSLAFRIPFSNSPPASLTASLAPGTPLAPGGWPMTEPVLNGNPYGHGTWPVYFLLNFVGMAALGLTCENMAMFLSSLSPLPYSALFLIWWVIANVSTGFYALELASDFYRWGYAWPLRHIVMGSKALVFGTKNELGLNFGVLFAWVAVGTLLFPAACWVLRWKGVKDRRKAKELERKVAALGSVVR